MPTVTYNMLKNMCTEVEYRLDIRRDTNGSHTYKVDNRQKNESFSLLLCERDNRF